MKSKISIGYLTVIKIKSYFPNSHQNAIPTLSKNFVPKIKYYFCVHILVCCYQF